MLPRTNPSKTRTWAELEIHQKELHGQHLRDWFLSDPLRFEKFSLQAAGLLFDFSKNIITKKTLDLFEQLFDKCQIQQAIAQQREGQKINETERRAVLHTALRSFDTSPLMVNGKDVMPEILASRKKMKDFSQQVIEGVWLGYTGQKITDVVNIGIGGSSLGPSMVYEALSYYHIPHIRCHFVSNIDGSHIAETLKTLNPETTLFIIASKSFSTEETMMNAHTARSWFIKNGGSEKHIAKHFVAVSTHQDKVEAFGIDGANMFGFSDWVGGRYSVWSPIGLSLCCGLGYDHFESFLKGAAQMDEHFYQAPFYENAPMLMAAIGIWYTNFWGCQSEAIIPYSQNLKRLPAYFQQGNMESNGKSTDRNGQPVSYTTGPIIWGQPGTNGQHAFFQHIHQGTALIPCDFIGFARSEYQNVEHHKKLMSNFFAQTEALMKGKTKAELQAEGVADDLVPYKIFNGNKPTTSIMAPMLTPASLGKIIACYEHKIFVQGIVWNIFSFDQWGVELGKVLAKNIEAELHNDTPLNQHDSSTAHLMAYYRQHQ